MLSFFVRRWGTFRCLGESKFGTSFLGPNVIFLCGWWFIDNVLHGIIYASMAFKDPQCVFYARLVKKISLISFSNALSLDIFGTLGGMCGTNPIGMFPYWKNYFRVGVRLLSRLPFFKFLGLLDSPLFFGIYGWKGTIIFLRVSF